MVDKTELILICLVAVALLAIVARKIRVPYPILLTIGGVGLALVPGLPAIQLDPQLVFNLFLPPLLYPAAVYTSWRDFRANLRQILPLAIVLVLLTMTTTAYLLHYLVGLPLAVGFVFGAIISPPDAVAALAVTQHLRVPRRIIVILEGESLVNDATAFIAFRFAVAAVMTGAFSLGQASLQFLLVATGGVCVGLAVGWLATEVQKRLDDPPVQTMLSLLTPYAAYFSGEAVHVSGILAVVIAGIYYGWRAPRILSGRMRLQALPVWEMVTFILNGVLFMLIGLQLPQVMNALAPGMATRVVELAIVVVLVIVLVRIVWMFGANYLPRIFGRKARRKNRVPWQHTALIAWDRDAWSRFARWCARDPIFATQWRTIPRTQPDPLAHLLRHLRNPRFARTDAYAPSSLARSCGRSCHGKRRKTGAFEGQRSSSGSARSNRIVASGSA